MLLAYLARRRVATEGEGLALRVAVTAPFPGSYNIYAGLGVGGTDLRVVLLNSSRSPCILIAALVLCSGGFVAPSLWRINTNGSLCLEVGSGLVPPRKRQTCFPLCRWNLQLHRNLCSDSITRRARLPTAASLEAVLGAQGAVVHVILDCVSSEGMGRGFTPSHWLLTGLLFPLVGRGKKRQSQESVERVDLDDVVTEEGRDGSRKEQGFKQCYKTEQYIFL